MGLNNALIKILFFVFICTSAFAQTGPNTFLISFTNKGATGYTLNNPSAYLSQRAIERRQKQNIGLDSTDLPLNAAYVNAVASFTGVQVVCRSKWLNNITVLVNDTSMLAGIRALPFVKGIERNRSTVKNKLVAPKYDASPARNTYFTGQSNSYYGMAETHITMLNGQMLHELGYTGSKMLIAVIDNGFINVNAQPAFAHLYAEGKITTGPDFAHRDNDAYLGGGSHGALVFSTMAAKIPGTYVGTAPDASYLLLVSENDTSEYVVEEDFWLAAAEWADSAGADVFNTSLGYTQFDDSTLNHVYAQLDGNTTRITKGVDLAAKKGIISVNSAGNSGANTWYYISAPADADSNLTVGAVGPDRLSAFFSSRGPSADGRVKPNVCAQGFRCNIIWTDGVIAPGNGTSFSSPIMAGITACLWEAFPDKTNMQIIYAIEQSASRYPASDDSLGYGVPDMAKAFRLLQNSYSATGFNLMVLNNPFQDQIGLMFYPQQDLEAELVLYDLNGKRITTEKIALSKNIHTHLNLDVNTSLLRSGVYILKINTALGTSTVRLVKS